MIAVADTSPLCYLALIGEVGLLPRLFAGDSLRASVARMAKVGSCGSPAFSPDGSRLAFVSNLTGVPQVWTVNT